MRDLVDNADRAMLRPLNSVAYYSGNELAL